MINGQIVTREQRNMKNPASKLLEADIKAMLLEHLLGKRAISNNTVVINELTIDNFARRVDLVTVDHKHLYAYEIKSEADSLYRLEDQVGHYLRFFDKVTIVAAPKHIDNIVKIVPSDVCVMQVTAKGFKVIQRGRTKADQCKTDLLKLMTAADLRKLSSRVSANVEKNNRAGLESALLSSATSTIRKAAIQSLVQRYEDSSRTFWSNIKDSIYAEQIRHLSPYLEHRDRLFQAQIEQSEFWSAWCIEVQKLPDDPLMANLAQEHQSELFGDVPASVKVLLAA